MTKVDFWKKVIGHDDDFPWPLPQLTNEQRDQIVQLIPGLTIFNTDENTIQVYDGFRWASYIADKTPGYGIWTRVTSNFPAMSGHKYIIDTTGGPITMTLPSNPRQGDVIEYVDGGGTFWSNNLTVNKNGQSIRGSNTNFVVAQTMSGSFLFVGGTEGWKVIFDTSSLKPALKTSSFTAILGTEYDCDTTNNAFNVTLPANPTEQSRVIFNDFNRTWHINNLGIMGNGKLIGGADNLICNISARIVLIYSHGQWTF